MRAHGWGVRGTPALRTVRPGERREAQGPDAALQAQETRARQQGNFRSGGRGQPWVHRPASQSVLPPALGVTLSLGIPLVASMRTAVLGCSTHQPARGHLTSQISHFIWFRLTLNLRVC